jgi:hypothetical protein
VAPVEVFRSDHGIQFIKGASFGKLPLFPHLERSYSGSPLSWNPLNGDWRNSPRFSSSSGHNSPGSFRDSNSPHLSIMMTGTPPVFDTATSPPSLASRRLKESPFTISIPAHDASTPALPSPDSPNGQLSSKLRRPFSMPDNGGSSPQGSMRMSASTIGHVQVRREKKRRREEVGIRNEPYFNKQSRQLRTSASSPASLDVYEEDVMMPNEEVLMQQGEHEREERGVGEQGEGDMGITPRRGRPAHMLSQSTSSLHSARPSLRESREARTRKAKEEEMKEDKKLKKSFKELLSGIFTKKGSR